MGYKKLIKRIAKFILTSSPTNYVTIQVSSINHGEILKNKSIVITGGSKGIGYSIAQKCISEGANVLIIGRNLKTLQEANKNLGEKSTYLQFDVSQIKEIPKLLEQCKKLLGGNIDCWVNNAGISLHEGSFKNVTIEGFEMQMNINLKAYYFLSKAFLEMKLKERKEGNLLLVSSETAALYDDIPYGMTKAAINSLTGALAKRVYKSGIRVNAIAPGVTLTDMTKDYAIDPSGNLSTNDTGGRNFLPNEIAEVACFLLSQASQCITGQVIYCDGGNHIKLNRENVD